MEETDKIELRSEKVRYIIEEIPPNIVRHGILIITLIVLGLLTAMYFIPYPETVTAKAIVLDEKQIAVYLPYQYVNSIKNGMKVNVELEGYDAEIYGYKNGQIICVDKKTKTGKTGNQFTAIAMVNIGRYRMMKGMMGSVNILITDKSILERIFRKIVYSD